MRRDGRVSYREPMAHRKRIACAVLLLVLTACATPPRTGPGSADPGEGLPRGWSTDRATAEFVHAATGFRFAPMRGDCLRTQPHNYDATGENTSVGYNCPQSGAWLTFYVYPTAYGGLPEPERHFRAVVGDALSAHPGSQVERAAQTSLPLGARVLPAFAAQVRWFEDEREVGSFVVLVPDGERFVKVRSSVGLGVADEGLDTAWKLTEDVLLGVAGASRTQ